MCWSSSGLTLSTDQRPGTQSVSESPITVRTASWLVHPQHQAADWREELLVMVKSADVQLNVWDFATQNQNQNPQPQSHTSFPTMHPRGRRWTLVNLQDQSQTPDCLNWSCCPEEVRSQMMSSHNQQTNKHLFTWKSSKQKNVTWRNDKKMSFICDYLCNV